MDRHISLHQRLDLIYFKFEKRLDFSLNIIGDGAWSRGGKISEARDAINFNCENGKS